MDVLSTLKGRSRPLAVGGVLAAAMALASLASAHRASAQAPVIQLHIAELHVTSAEVKYLSGGFFTPGYYLVFVVKNTGTANAGAFTVDVRDTSNATLESLPVNGMAADGGRMFWHKLPNPPHCGYGYAGRKIVVDRSNTVLETNEANNTFVTNEQYGGGPC